MTKENFSVCVYGRWAVVYVCSHVYGHVYTGWTCTCLHMYYLENAGCHCMSSSIAQHFIFWGMSSHWTQQSLNGLFYLPSNFSNNLDLLNELGNARHLAFVLASNTDLSMSYLPSPKETNSKLLFSNWIME